MSDPRHFSAADVDALDPRDVFDAVESAFAMVSGGEAIAPIRAHVGLGDGADSYFISGALPAFDIFTVKVINVVPANAGRGLERLQGSLTAFEISTGRPIATLDAQAVTRVRTAAGSAVSMRRLARPDADVLTVFGRGPQSDAHVRALTAEWEFREVRVVGRGDDVASALAGAGVIVGATNSTTPLFSASDVAPGTHLALVGSASPTAAEVDPALLGHAAVFVDHKPTCIAEAGEIVQAVKAGVLKADDVHEIGELILGRVPGRRSDADITVYKSVGNGTQDAAVAALLLGHFAKG
ncbi:MAG TPA: ornithine cyclodeaminase family protein [Candidatus Dormibacteraeota bacterium]|nr:ornithine cyclodeaminase family protein [Candidatus Dormibacteraeota bacterium]